MTRQRDNKGRFISKTKPRIKAIEHRVSSLDIEFSQRGKKRRLLRIQRYREPVKIKDIDLTPNPEKLTFLLLRNKYGDRLEIFVYKNNPKKGFISLNGQVIGADKFKWRECASGIMKLGKFLGVLK